MKCEDIQLLLADYVDGALAPADQEQVRRHAESCAACAAELSAQRRIVAALSATPGPVPSLRSSTMFHTWLDAEREAASARDHALASPANSWLRNLMGSSATALAACVLFAAGILVGGRSGTPPTANVRDEAARQELAHLRQEMATMTKAVAWTMLEQQSASERLKAVLALNGSPTRAQTPNELLGVLAYDTSSTVRQTAVDALYRYIDDATVRRAVANALPRESSPVVQLAMIDLLAATHDPVAAHALETFALSDTPPTVVRDAASFARARM